MIGTKPAPRPLAGLLLAGLLIGIWGLSIGLCVFALPLRPATFWLVPILMFFHMWLFVGLFIMAHDAMHGSLAPGRVRLNRWIGSLCLFLYAGFDFGEALPKHHAHHGAPGGPQDPDGHPAQQFWPWYGRFVGNYFGLRNVLFVSLVLAALLILGAKPANALLFWAAPAILSSLQLFLFGTYLPHRRAPIPFKDAHNARSNDWPEWLSLLTCFHFGYHHEHHLHPGAPWWRLPGIRRKERAAQ